MAKSLYTMDGEYFMYDDKTGKIFQVEIKEPAFQQEKLQKLIKLIVDSKSAESAADKRGSGE